MLKGEFITFYIYVDETNPKMANRLEHNDVNVNMMVIIPLYF